jgi:hypothetical protein
MTEIQCVIKIHSLIIYGMLNTNTFIILNSMQFLTMFQQHQTLFYYISICSDQNKNVLTITLY